MNHMKTVVILGASDKSERYSNKALLLLKEKGYDVVPVNPTLETLEGIPVVHALADVARHPDVLTVYVNPERSTAMMADMLALAPRVAIFNPDTENDALESQLAAAGVRIVRACSVVLLKTGAFESTVTPKTA